MYGALPVFILICVGVLTGCSGSSPTGVSAGDDLHAHSHGGPVATTSPSAPADPLQAEILADGYVTAAEMERALLAVVGCVRDAGYVADLVEFVPAQGWTFVVSGGDSAAEADLVDQRLALCSAALISEVEVVYLKAHAPTQTEMQERERAILACMYDHGLNVLSLAAAGELVDHSMRAGDHETVAIIQECFVAGSS